MLGAVAAGTPSTGRPHTSNFVDLSVPCGRNTPGWHQGPHVHQEERGKADKVTGRLHSQFKTYAICGAIYRMNESSDFILQLATANSFQRASD